jgi:co-chaperonin GroES (HSP10)
MAIVNTSGIKPKGVSVLVLPYEPELKGTALYIPPKVKTAMGVLENRVIVVEVGPAAWADEDEPRAKAGDKVFVTKHAGFTATGPADGLEYRLVSDRDIFAQITDEVAL